MKITFVKGFIGFQLIVGLLFIIQALKLLLYSFPLSIGATALFIHSTVSGSIWLLAGLGLWLSRKWGWPLATALYTGCLVYQLWVIGRIMFSDLSGELERFAYSNMFNAGYFLIMVVILLAGRKRF